MDIFAASWQGRSHFYLPGPHVRDLVSGYIEVAVTMTEMPFFTVDRINIPLNDGPVFKIGDNISDPSGFISLTPPSMQQVTTDGEIHYWCIDLFRGMSSRLFGIDIGAQSSPYLPVSTFSWLVQLSDELRAAPDSQTRASICDHVLSSQMARLEPADEIEAALFQIFAHEEAITVQALADLVGTNRRKLERLFQKRLGYSPLQEMSMANTFRTLENMVHGEPEPWHQQENARFADQSHFIRRTKQLTGTTPSTLTGKYIWPDNTWFPDSEMDEHPNSIATFNAWSDHYRARIERLGEHANVSADELSRAAERAFRPIGPAPDYPLSPWTIM